MINDDNQTAVGKTSGFRSERELQSCYTLGMLSVQTYTCIEECSGSVCDLRLRSCWFKLHLRPPFIVSMNKRLLSDRGFEPSPAPLCCVLEQDTLILA